MYLRGLAVARAPLGDDARDRLMRGAARKTGATRTQQSQRVVVTGGAGYIGSVLVRLLLDKGYGVEVLDCLRSGGESLLEVREHPKFGFTKGDINMKYQ